jgi:DNA polymerase III subunit epsilon
MYLLFDTETTGLPKNWKAPVTDLRNWPRLVQIAWLFYDEKGNQSAFKNYIIKPEGINIPPEVTRIHGISNEMALVEGSNLNLVLSEFKTFIDQAEFLVAHNISFDEKIVGAEFLRCNMTNILPDKRRICTMEKTTDFCAIPGPYGYKWPRLSELHHKLFQSDYEEKHNAAADILATAKCFWELKRIGRI